MSAFHFPRRSAIFSTTHQQTRVWNVVLPEPCARFFPDRLGPASDDDDPALLRNLSPRANDRQHRLVHFIIEATSMVAVYVAVLGKMLAMSIITQRPIEV